MQYSIVSAISTVLFASSLSAAAAIPANAQPSISEISLQLKTGDGDSSVGRSVAQADFGSLLTQDSNGAAFKGVAISMNTAGARCGVFDVQNGAPIKQGGLTFTDVKADGTSDTAVFGLNGSNGGTGAQLEEAISVALCCDTQAAFAKSCAKPQFKSGDSRNARNGNNNARGGSVNNAGATPAAGRTDGSDTVVLQFSGPSEFAIQRSIPANGQVTPVRGAVGVDTIQVITTNGQVVCEAFSDANARNKIGGRFDNIKKANGDATDFESQQAVTVKAVACAAAGQATE